LCSKSCRELSFKLYETFTIEPRNFSLRRRLKRGELRTIVRSFLDGTSPLLFGLANA
jgi:hypothetical protein